VSRRWGGDGDGEKTCSDLDGRGVEAACCLLTRAWRNPNEGNGREKGRSGVGPNDESMVTDQPQTPARGVRSLMLSNSHFNSALHLVLIDQFSSVELGFLT
jgi:hypothetical protein